ncbi:hypothetical protein BCR39DRAFT_597909 [Naematelia encephala]|uniref:Uncharacterized protein n=1 Tax=Naematelia encephala TaxID=71784 RepID=A0A1Y2BB59_9TREE|nr:hypothetical protein BCR39DRAFT_597909 [Naematelia encephala]
MSQGTGTLQAPTDHAHENTHPFQGILFPTGSENSFDLGNSSGCGAYNLKPSAGETGPFGASVRLSNGHGGGSDTLRWAFAKKVGSSPLLDHDSNTNTLGPLNQAQCTCLESPAECRSTHRDDAKNYELGDITDYAFDCLIFPGKTGWSALHHQTDPSLRLNLIEDLMPKRPGNKTEAGTSGRRTGVGVKVEELDGAIPCDTSGSKEEHRAVGRGELKWLLDNNVGRVFPGTNDQSRTTRSSGVGFSDNTNSSGSSQGLHIKAEAQAPETATARGSTTTQRSGSQMVPSRQPRSSPGRELSIGAQTSGIDGANFSTNTAPRFGEDSRGRRRLARMTVSGSGPSGTGRFSPSKIAAKQDTVAALDTTATSKTPTSNDRMGNGPISQLTPSSPSSSTHRHGNPLRGRSARRVTFATPAGLPTSPSSTLQSSVQQAQAPSATGSNLLTGIHPPQNPVYSQVPQDCTANVDTSGVTNTGSSHSRLIDDYYSFAKRPPTTLSEMIERRRGTQGPSPPGSGDTGIGTNSDSASGSSYPGPSNLTNTPHIHSDQPSTSNPAILTPSASDDDDTLGGLKLQYP